MTMFFLGHVCVLEIGIDTWQLCAWAFENELLTYWIWMSQMPNFIFFEEGNASGQSERVLKKTALTVEREYKWGLSTTNPALLPMRQRAEEKSSLT